MNGVPAIMATVTLVGFAIQQALEVLSPLGDWFAGWCEKGTLESRKKWAMAVLGFALGCVAVGTTKMSLLTFVNPHWDGWGDFVVTALIFGSGSEGINTLLKFFEYVKAGRKNGPAVAIGVTTPNVNVPVNGTITFEALVVNTNDRTVAWRVAETDGGTIDDQGAYTAPAKAGTYKVVATSQADPTKHATVEIQVT